ncbi:hypothetical protein BDZ89DRAFT_1141450 [Hymenopellis radicata]|nr:hypothetical protein BDZ89DRAFT_1141450 [Hymenopellis radicata]
MFAASYEEENMSKPAITQEIEGADDGQTADQAAQAMWRGLERATRTFPIVDAFLDWVSFRRLDIRTRVESVCRSKVKAHAKDHEKYVQDKGFFEMPI